MPTPVAPDTDSLGANPLSVALIGPDESRRAAVAEALSGPLCGNRRELNFYPDLEEAQKLIERNFDVVIVDLDSNPEVALDLVESICARTQATVMVFSAGADAELMIRCMRAGAREFLTQPFAPGKLAEALVRASARRTATRAARKADGKVLVFWGAKGGAGVTTLASTFATWLAKESQKKVLLIDFDLPLGDAVLALGISGQYSTVEALQNFHRMDANFLNRLLIQHDSGLSVLGSPGKMVKVESSKEAIDKLLWVSRQEFDYVVVDSGSNLDLIDTALFDLDAVVYLITDVNIPELRNANRLITEWLATDGRRLEIVLNRYTNSTLGVDDEHIAKALTRHAQWRIPEDHGAARKMQATPATVALSESPISGILRQMARTACGLPATPEKKKGKLGLF
ncbi:MAG TPA: AAA family ATPase [Terracidiphilus sp.]